MLGIFGGASITMVFDTGGLEVRPVARAAAAVEASMTTVFGTGFLADGA